ncbi:MAG: hypothetical protein NVS9B4_00940 [Candidatus Acidiferrum sp.]
MPDPLLALEQHRAAFMDARLHAFEGTLHNIVLDVNSRTAAYLQGALSITNGVIDSSSGNLRILRTLNNRILKEMDRAGLRALIDAFVAQFPGQLPFIYDEIRLLQIVLPGILPSFRFKPDQFAAFQLNAVSSIETVVERAAAGVANRGMLVVGGLKFGKLIASIADKFKRVVPDAATVADTASSVFYRIATAEVYSLIQRAMPDNEQKFKYFNVIDIKTRPFCRHLVKLDKTYTRVEIAKLSNGQIDNVWISCGGWGCRGRWRLAVDIGSASIVAKYAVAT